MKYVNIHINNIFVIPINTNGISVKICANESKSIRLKYSILWDLLQTSEIFL